MYFSATPISYFSIFPYVPEALFWQLEGQRQKIYSWAIWEKLWVLEHLRGFHHQNEYIEAQLHWVYQDYNIGRHIYINSLDQVELVKPGYSYPVVYQIKEVHPVIGARVSHLDPAYYVYI